MSVKQVIKTILKLYDMQNLEPKEVFGIFAEITQVPRPSKKEGKIIAFLQDFAKKHHLEHATDQAGNIIIRKPATVGYEAKPGIILQAHMDMVCEKNADIQHDFDNDPIETYVDGDWLKARGTTLGADNGIGMAMALATLCSDQIKHPALECLFTVDEETGLTGAFALDNHLLKGKSLINLDSEDDGQIFIGCAGGIDTVATFPIAWEKAPADYFAAKVSIKGLLGGHSGDDIEKGRGNANKILNRFLYRLNEQTDLRISHIDGGNLRNAIAREAYAIICVPHDYKEPLRIELNHFIADIEQEIGKTETGFRMELESESLPGQVLAKELSVRLIQAVYACPHGVMAMSRDMPGLVESSTNLASIKMDGQEIIITTSQRSSIESAKHDVRQMVACTFKLAGATVTHGDGYPGWKPNVDSALLRTAQQSFSHLFGETAKVRAIHAGLECGLFLEKYPHLDMISIGPDMRGVHSPSEQLSIKSTQRCWMWLQNILENL